jgi:hypothetical protein
MTLHGLARESATCVTFWLDDFRFFEGQLKDEIGREEEFAVDAQGKLSTTWGRLKSQF